MGYSLGGFRPKGALLDCFITYPQFREDLPVLIAEGYVEITSPETCVWNKSKTSLAQYFKWAGYDTGWVTGGFWAPIAKAFGEKQRSLSKGASPNANPLKREYSRDFIKIRPLLEKHRKQELLKQNESRVYNYIKKLILSAEDEEQETIHEIVHKIGAVFQKIVDKN